MADAEGARVVALGERLRRHRAEQGLSQAQAARELDVARTAYRLWELEAAKPSPDRWRLIARWLGVSISTMLLGEDLIDDEDSDAADLIAGHASTTILDVGEGDFFEQERPTIARQTRSGRITAAESARLTSSLDRVVSTMQGGAAVAPPGVFRKELVGDSTAAELARTALVVTTAGVDDEVVERAELLTSELVTNSVVRSEGRPLLLAITLHPDVLRVEVTDATATPDEAKPRDQRMRWSFAIIAELASRWGGGREADLNVSWFEIDIPA